MLYNLVGGEKPWMGQSEVFPSSGPRLLQTNQSPPHTILPYHITLPLTISCHSTIQCQWSHRSALISTMSCGDYCHLYWLCRILRLQFSGVIYSGVDHVLWYCGLKEDGIGIGGGCRGSNPLLECVALISGCCHRPPHPTTQYDLDNLAGR